MVSGLEPGCLAQGLAGPDAPSRAWDHLSQDEAAEKGGPIYSIDTYNLFGLPFGFEPPIFASIKTPAKEVLDSRYCTYTLN